MADWWSEPSPKPKRNLNWGEIAAGAGAGGAAAAGITAGAMLLTRGKVKPKVKIRTKTKVIRAKAPKGPKGPDPADAFPKRKSPVADPEGDAIKARTEVINAGEGERIAERRRLMARAQVAIRRNEQMAEAAREAKKRTVLKPKPWTKADSNDLDPRNVGIREANDTPPAPSGVGPVPQRPGAKERRRRRAAAAKNGVAKADQRILADRAVFDIMDEVAKAATLMGEPGDKRNTKYAVAGGLGYLAGVNAGTHLGAKAAGTTYRQNREQNVRAVQRLIALRQTPKGQPVYLPSLKELNKISRKIKGTNEIRWGGKAGAAAGIAAGVGGVYAYRHRKPKIVQ